MNLIDMLFLKKRILNRDNMGSLLFSFTYTLLFLILMKYLINWLQINQLFSSSDLELLKIFFTPFILLLFIFLFYISYLIPREELDFYKYYSKLFELKSEDMTLDNFKKYFDFQGVLNNVFNGENCLHLNLSSEGLITKRCFKNYLLEFESELLVHGFGIILLAKDLENYFMLRINIDEVGSLYVTPHIRKFGIWEIQEIKIEVDNKVKINIGKNYTFKISCKGRNINLIIEDGRKLIKSFQYFIPTHFNLLPSIDTNNENPKGVVARLELLLNGRIGFRAWGPDEHAIIYNIKVEKIRDK